MNPKFIEKFDEIFESEGIKVKRLPDASPNLNAYAERFVQSAQNKYLGHFIVFGGRHLEFLLREYEGYYNTVRPHQGIGNRTIEIMSLPPPDFGPPAPHEIECLLHLGGLLRREPMPTQNLAIYF